MTMTENLQSALLISAVGMGLVFAVILLLWGLMTLIVRLGAARGAADAAPVEPQAAVTDDTAERRRAAAVVAAVGAAVEQEHVNEAVRARAAAAAVAAYLAGEPRKR